MVVWQKAMRLTSSIYAEGCGRNSKKQKMYFFQIAQGSLAELDTQLILIRNLLDLEIDNGVWSLIEELQKMLSSLLKQ